jgi:hypothetical protein
LARFGDFLLNLLTPPDPRFGGLRKVIAVGDSTTQSSSLHGVLATGFRQQKAGEPRDAVSTLGARLMGGWQAQGRPHTGFFGSTLLMIDEQAPAKDPALGSAHFPGYYSVLRSGWGTPRETAIWFINGDFYRDHRHGDEGSVVLYALGAPLSLHWGGQYTPQTGSPFLHNVVLPEARIGHRWDQDNPPLNAPPVWGSSKAESFLSFPASATSRGRFTSGETAWVRSVSLIHPDEDRPMILIQDRLTGNGAREAKVFSLNLMAQGAVETPQGKVSPPLRLHESGQLPSVGQVFPLPAGVNRLGFTGQFQIDWDIYTSSSEDQQAEVGNWAHGWHPEQEKAEFRNAGGRNFEERQHILRIKGNGLSQVLIVPYRKGQKREAFEVKQEGSRNIFRAGAKAVTWGDDFYAYRDGRKQVLGCFGQQADEEGMAISGGPVELVVEPQRVTVTAHGFKGQRRFKIPGKWQIGDPRAVRSGLREQGGEWLLDYPGGEPLTLTLLRE